MHVVGRIGRDPAEVRAFGERGGGAGVGAIDAGVRGEGDGRGGEGESAGAQGKELEEMHFLLGGG